MMHAVGMRDKAVPNNGTWRHVRCMFINEHDGCGEEVTTEPPDNSVEPAQVIKPLLIFLLLFVYCLF